ncbi:MAG: hypothetical protein SFZ02_08420 [bacterium]|nr:hypothetical protein [bacterium]
MGLKGLLTSDIFRPIVTVLVFTVIMVTVKWVLFTHLLGLREPLQATIIGVGAFLLAIFIGALWLIWRANVTGNGSPMLIIFLFICIAIVITLPLPPQPDTPEKIHFLQYRADYEAVVALAKTRNLSQPVCDPPLPLYHVSSIGCLHVNSDDRGLTVAFYPLELFNYFVLYVEIESEIEKDAICNDSNSSSMIYLKQKIEPHWYVCTAHMLFLSNPGD